MGVGCSARGGRFAVPGSSDLTRRAADACSTDRGLALRNESSALRCDSLGSLQGRGRLFHGPEILLEPARHTGQTCRAGGLCVARVTRGSTWNGWLETKAVARALPSHRRVRKRRQRRMALVGSCSGERGRVHGNVRLERTAMFRGTTEPQEDGVGWRPKKEGGLRHLHRPAARESKRRDESSRYALPALHQGPGGAARTKADLPPGADGSGKTSLRPCFCSDARDRSPRETLGGKSTGKRTTRKSFGMFWPRRGRAGVLGIEAS